LQAVPSSLEEISEIQEAFEVARQSKLTPEEMEVFEKRQMALHDYHNAVLLGKMQGEREGERKAQVQIARSLLEILPAEVISQKTGLSLKEIEALQQA
ncbi:MAG: transposase, partial [Cyanobacteria bacterium J06643_4]